jgi:hypothetical protein
MSHTATCDQEDPGHTHDKAEHEHTHADGISDTHSHAHRAGQEEAHAHSH